MKLGEIRISRATTNEPNEPSRAREISARRSPSRAGITLLVRWLRGGSARSYARLVWLVCDARRVCSARCQPCRVLTGLIFPGQNPVKPRIGIDRLPSLHLGN